MTISEGYIAQIYSFVVLVHVKIARNWRARNEFTLPMQSHKPKSICIVSREIRVRVLHTDPRSRCVPIINGTRFEMNLLMMNNYSVIAFAALLRYIL